MEALVASQIATTTQRVVVPGEVFRGAEGHKRRLALHYGLIAELSSYSCHRVMDEDIWIFRFAAPQAQSDHVRAVFVEAFGSKVAVSSSIFSLSIYFGGK